MQQQPTLKKRPFEAPLINLNQTFSHFSTSAPSNDHKTINSSDHKGLLFRPSSLQSPRRGKPDQNNSRLEPRKEERKISFQGKSESRTIELGGFKPPQPTIKFTPITITPEQPRLAFTKEEPRGKITVTYSEHPHLMSMLRHREFSEKTIETKESEEDRQYFLKSEHSSSHHSSLSNFNN